MNRSIDTILQARIKAARIQCDIVAELISAGCFDRANLNRQLMSAGDGYMQSREYRVAFHLYDYRLGHNQPTKNICH